jgi:phosphoglycerate kinase
VLLRAGLCIPLKDGWVTDPTRPERRCPTICELAASGARIILCSHSGWPNGKLVTEMFLEWLEGKTLPGVFFLVG